MFIFLTLEKNSLMNWFHLKVASCKHFPHDFVFRPRHSICVLNHLNCFLSCFFFCKGAQDFNSSVCLPVSAYDTSILFWQWFIIPRLSKRMGTFLFSICSISVFILLGPKSLSVWSESGEFREIPQLHACKRLSLLSAGFQLNHWAKRTRALLRCLIQKMVSPVPLKPVNIIRSDGFYVCVSAVTKSCLMSSFIVVSVKPVKPIIDPLFWKLYYRLFLFILSSFIFIPIMDS